MLYRITANNSIVGDEYGNFIYTSMIKLTEGFPGELSEWYLKNQIDNWLKQNCAYYTKTWASSTGKTVTIEFQYSQHLNNFRKTWL